jgi:hypothetical protein
MPAKIEGPGTSLRALSGWGGMAAAYVELPAGTDLAPLLEGLPGNVCPCPHWGYLIKGRITVGHAEGGTEELRSGQLFYLPPGHLATVTEDAAFVEFSPDSEYQQVLKHVVKKATAV